MSYKPESQADKQRSHNCPQDCVRMIKTLYVDCEEQALPPEVVSTLKVCQTERHRFEVLPMQVDGLGVERCRVCGCWKF